MNFSSFIFPLQISYQRLTLHQKSQNNQFYLFYLQKIMYRNQFSNNCLQLLRNTLFFKGPKNEYTNNKNLFLVVLATAICNRNKYLLNRFLQIISQFLFTNKKSMKKIQSVLVSCIYAEQYRFILKKAETQTTLLDVDFAPIFKKQTKQFVPSYPSILHDKRSHMPFFFVPGHQSKPNENLYLQVHSTKIMESLQQKQQLYIPKPSIKNSCCIVCRSNFEDYLTHIQTSEHVQAVNSSQFNQEIKQLCQNFSRKRQYRNRQPSKQKTPSKPIKKRKIQQLPTLQLNVKSSSTVTIDSWIDITGLQK